MKQATVYWKHQPAQRTIGYTRKDVAILCATEPWQCTWEYDGQYRSLFVPADYVWDGASIPRPVWSIIGLTPGGIMCGPSLAHDPLYRAMGGNKPDAWMGCRLVNENGNRLIIDRAEADAVLFGAMDFALRVDGNLSRSDRRKIAICIPFVRVGGIKHWGGPCPAFRRD